MEERWLGGRARHEVLHGLVATGGPPPRHAAILPVRRTTAAPALLASSRPTKARTLGAAPVIVRNGRDPNNRPQRRRQRKGRSFLVSSQKFKNGAYAYQLLGCSLAHCCKIEIALEMLIIVVLELGPFTARLQSNPRILS